MPPKAVRKRPNNPHPQIQRMGFRHAHWPPPSTQDESDFRRFVNLEGSVRSRGTDVGCGAERDLIKAGLNEPADAAWLWDLCCGACSGRAALGAALRRCGQRPCGAIDVGRVDRRDERHFRLDCPVMFAVGVRFDKEADIGRHCVHRCRAAARLDARAIAYVHDISGRGVQRGSVTLMRRAPPQQGQTFGLKRWSCGSGWMISPASSDISLGTLPWR